MQNHELVARLEEKLEVLLQPKGLEVVDVQYLSFEGSMVLRIFIDNPETGVDLQTCERTSRVISEWLDINDPIPGDSYLLEVSSPGIDRILKKDRDFKRFEGSQVKVKLKQKIDGQRNLKGILVGYDPESITIMVDDKSWQLPRAQIAYTRLDPEI
ncbi:MAG: ribosome maturation factor RimP [Methylocystaceae bacterium]